MSDKSPRQEMSKKSGKSIKEKRADKRAKASRTRSTDKPRPGQEAVTLLGLGVIGTSAKENEHRLPLHPEHLARLDADLRERITLEHGYGERFGYSDTRPRRPGGGLASREEILAGSDVVVLPKPQHADLARMREGRCSGAGRTASRTRC